MSKIKNKKILLILENFFREDFLSYQEIPSRKLFPSRHSCISMAGLFAGLSNLLIISQLNMLNGYLLMFRNRYPHSIITKYFVTLNFSQIKANYHENSSITCLYFSTCNGQKYLNFFNVSLSVHQNVNKSLGRKKLYNS